TMSDGTTVEINGTPEEVSALVEKLRSQHQEDGSPTTATSAVIKRKGKVEIRDLVNLLKSEDFFTTPRGLGDIQKKFGEMGHHYPVTTLSGAMQSQAQSRNLRRFKQHGKYVYVQ